LFAAIVLLIPQDAYADVRSPSFSEKHPLQTGLLGAGLACVVAAAGFVTLKLTSDRVARWSIAVLILVLTLLAIFSSRELFQRKQRDHPLIYYYLTLERTTSDNPSSMKTVDATRHKLSLPCTPDC
jgi:hypothetical protein